MNATIKIPNGWRKLKSSEMLRGQDRLLEKERMEWIKIYRPLCLSVSNMIAIRRIKPQPIDNFISK